MSLGYEKNHIDINITCHDTDCHGTKITIRCRSF